MAVFRVTKGGVLRDQNDKTLDQLFDRLAASPDDARLMFYFHGGLVPEDKGMSIAKGLAEGGFKPLKYEQVYIVWKTGLLETVQTNFLELAKSKSVMRIARHLIELILGRIGGDGRGAGSLSAPQIETRIKEIEDWAEAQQSLDGPKPGEDKFPAADTAPARGAGADRIGDYTVTPEDEDWIDERLTSDEELQDAARGIDVAVAPEAAARGGLQPSARALAEGRWFVDHLREDAREDLRKQVVKDSDRAIGASTIAFLIKNAIKVARAVLKRFDGNRHHGAWPTLVEEIARALFVGDLAADIWNLMKNDAGDHFRAPNRPDGAIWIQGLVKLAAAKKAQGKELHLAIGGHSAGSILAMHFLRAIAANADLGNVRAKVVLMAPAVDLETFSSAWKDAENIVGDIRVFTMTDAAESEDALLGPFYPRSLLYMISGASPSGTSTRTPPP